MEDSLSLLTFKTSDGILKKLIQVSGTDTSRLFEMLLFNKDITKVSASAKECRCLFYYALLLSVSFGEIL